MGNYYNPPEQIKEVGRKLEGETWAELQAELQPGEVMLGLFYIDRSRASISIGTPGDMVTVQGSGGHYACPHIPDEREFAALRVGGHATVHGYFAAFPADINKQMDDPIPGPASVLAEE